MRKQLNVLLAICLVLSLACQIKPSAAVAYDDSFNVSGYTMSEDYYKATYGSKTADGTEIKSGETKTAADVRISDIEVKDNAISLSLNMGTGGKNMVIGGKLYKSAMNQHGVNSIVVDAKCTDSSYGILLFEIWNDSAADHQILYNTTVRNVPHVKLYLQNSNDDISAFEFPLPAALNELEASNYEKADSSIDLLWPMKVVDVTVTEAPTDDYILELLGLNDPSREVSTWTTWQNSRTYFLTFTNMGTEFTSVSLPYVDYRYTNVTSVGGTWIASFEVAEHTSTTNAYGDYLSFYGDNAFSYRNVRLAFACGDNTTVISTFQQGRMVDSLFWLGPTWIEDGARIAVGILELAADACNIDSSYFSLLTLLASIEPFDQTVTLGSNNVTLMNSLTVTAGVQLDERYYISECTNQNGEENIGDYLTYHANVLYENAGGNTNTVGVLNIEFDVCVENQDVDGYPKPRSTNIAFYYSSSP